MKLFFGFGAAGVQHGTLQERSIQQGKELGLVHCWVRCKALVALFLLLWLLECVL